MLLETFNDQFNYERLSAEEMKQRGILGRLKGVIADFKNPTRNGRRYSEKLWQKVFEDPIMQEKIANRCVFGELAHPTDRTEIDPEKIAICLAEQPKKGKDGKLYGVFDILATPNGKILKTLCDYGCTVGISSRGSGDVITDFDGQEAVDPDTYECECWDVVLVPGVKEARLQYVNESLEKKRYNKTLKEKLTESLSRASEDDRKIMNETLEGLGIELNKDNPTKEDCKEEMEDVNLDEQAMDRGAAIDRCSNLSKQFVKHFDKIYNDINEETMKHHGAEMQACFDQAAAIKLKNTGRQINEMQLYDWFITDGKLPVDLFDNETEAEVYDDFATELLNNDHDVLNALRRCELLSESYKAAHTKDIKDESLNINEEQNLAVDNNEAIVEELQNTLKANAELESKVIELQEKLSVCYTKEARAEEEISRQKKAISKLSESVSKANALDGKVGSLEKKISYLQGQLKNSEGEVVKLQESLKLSSVKKTSLQESLSSKDAQLTKLKEALNSKELEISKMNESFEKDKSALNEDIAELKKDLNLKKSEYSSKLEKSNKLVEKYQGIATKAVNKYIENEAVKIGVSINEVKNRLPEKYTFEDIDLVCEDLQNYKLNVSKLPFNTSLNENLKVRASSSKRESILPVSRFDDEVDESLLSLAGVKTKIK